MARNNDNTFNADVTCLQEPLKLILDGKTYEIPNISMETMDELMAIERDTDKEERLISDILPKQMSLLTRCPEDEFYGKDVRQLGACVRWVMQQLNSEENVKAAVRQAKKG